MCENLVGYILVCLTSLAYNSFLPLKGLSEEDAQLLSDEVAIVFHCAATVKFDEPLRASIQMNVRCILVKESVRGS